MRIWWCQEHQMAQLGETNACDKGYEFAETDTCQIVLMRLIPDNAAHRFEVQLSTDEEVESLDLQYWHQDLTDFVWAKGGWAWFVLIPIDGPALAGETP